MNKEFKIKYSRGSGPGGQHKNKVETCVEIVHVPTGLKERCQDTRSRARNEKIALYRLDVKITALHYEEAERKRNEARKEQIKDKKAIRTYNFARNEVVDHRTGSRANLRRFLDGDLGLLK